MGEAKMNSERELDEFWKEAKPYIDKYHLTIKYYLVDGYKERLSINDQVIYISENSVYASIEEVKKYCDYLVNKPKKNTKHFKEISKYWKGYNGDTFN
jgi:Na+/phosphate symporter